MAKRRGPGDGSITQYQTQHGTRWRVQLTIPGRPKRADKAGFKTRREAQAWCDEQRKRLADGADIMPQRVTVAEFLDRWLADVVRPGRREGTIVSYEAMVRVHILPAIGAIRLVDLRGHHLQRLYAESLAAGLAPDSVRTMHTVVHAALGWAVRWELVTRNVADAVQPPAREHREMSVLAPEQARRLIEETTDDRDHALWVLALTTGMRQGELLALAWDSIDFDAGVVRVTGSLGRSGRIGAVKTARGRRSIGISTYCMAALRRHRAHQARERLALGPAWRGDNRVFTTRVGGPADRSYANYAFRVTLQRLGLPRVRFHDLRHTAATLMLAAGIHPKVVSERLGHANISITLNTYSHVLPEMQADAAERIDALLTG